MDLQEEERKQREVEEARRRLRRNLETQTSPTPEQATHERVKAGKVRLELVPFGFVIEMAKAFMQGLADVPERKPHDWQRLDSDAVAEDCRGALLRHYAAGQWASVATNAAILWWHEQKTKGQTDA
jgi:hypothetical protein